jgi:TonB family protein
MPRRVAGSPSAANVRADLPPDIRVGSGGAGEGTGTGPRTGAGTGAGGAGGNEGTVLLSVWVRADGTVESAKIDQSAGWPSLDESAMKAVMAWKFNPARRGGVAVPFNFRLPVIFNIRD